MSVNGGHDRPPLRRQPGPYEATSRHGGLPIVDSQSTASPSQTSWESWQSPERNPALMTGLKQSHVDDTQAYLGLRWAPVILLVACSSLGLGSLAIADSLSRQGYGYGTTSVFFWFGLLLIFVPTASRVLMRSVDRRERLALVILLGIALYGVKVLRSPDGFTFVDEYIHLRNTEDILRTHHVFGLNPLLPTAAYYPGLAAVTAGLVNITGLSTFVSGLIVIGLARILISACFYLIAERVTRSDRAAACASLIYAANPMFLFWSSSFAYEDLALPLAAFAIWWLGRTRSQTNRLVPVVTTISIIAVTVTHHVVGFALSALLGIWWLVDRLTHRASTRQHSLGPMALVAGSATLIWFFFVARPAASYLITNNLVPAVQQTASLVFGHRAARHLYTSGGYVSPKWETLAGFAGVGLLVLALPPALYAAWRIAFRGDGMGRRWHLQGRVPLAIATAVAIAYPFSLLPRLTTDGVAISGRSSEYIFTGLGCLLGLLAEDPTWWPRRGPRYRRRVESTTRKERSLLGGWRRTFAATCAVTVVFVGNVTIGTAFYERMPESPNPQGYPWTVQADVVNASNWAREHLGINQRFGASSIDSLALVTNGDEITVPESSVWPIFFADRMNNTVVHYIRTEKVRYLLVDWRMTLGVPPSPGYYFSPQEPDAGQYRQPFPAVALRKFTSNCTRLIYHSGEVQIFDVSRIENGSCVPEAAESSPGKLVSP